MKSILVLLASAGLVGCVAYAPGAYEAPSPYGAYGSPYYGPYVVDPPGYYYGAPVVPYGYGWGRYGSGPGYPGHYPHGYRPGRGDGGPRGRQPPRLHIRRE